MATKDKDNKNPIHDYDIYDANSLFSGNANTRTQIPGLYSINETLTPKIHAGASNYPESSQLLHTHTFNAQQINQYPSIQQNQLQIPSRRQNQNVSPHNSYYDSAPDVTNASLSNTSRSSTGRRASENRTWIEKTMLKLGALIRPPKITSQYSNFKVPILSQRLPFLFRNFCLVIAFVGIVIALCACLIVYFALTKSNSCVGSCKSVGEKGLYLFGFGIATASTLNMDSDEIPRCSQYQDGMTYYVLLNAEQFGNFDPPSSSPVCGKCMFISGPKNVVRAMIVGSCKNCTFGGIMISQPAFDYLKPNDSIDTFPVSWGPC